MFWRCLWEDMNISQWKIGDRTFFSLEVDDRLLLIDNQYTFYRHIILTVMLRIKMWIKYSFSRHKVSVYLIDLYLRLQSVRYVTCFQSLPLPVDARMMVVTAGLSASYCPQDRSVSLISGTRRVRVTGGGVTPAPAPSCSLPPPPPHLRPVSGVW